MEIQEITSPANVLVKHLVKLRENKTYRQQCRRLVISGLKLVKELALCRPFSTLFVQEGTPLLPGVKADKICYVTAAILKKVTGLENPESVAAEVEMPVSADVTEAPLLLVLEGIADPGNLGTLLRTALCLGWNGVFITEGSVDPFNDKAIRAAKGATFRLPWRIGSYEELQALLSSRKGSVLTADAQGKEAETLSFRLPLTLILGNEAHGPSSLFKNTSQLVAVKMHGQMESLNVASAGAILMDHIKRILT